MGEDDRLFIGLDLKKDPAVILNAYNDPSGYTRDFNLNLLYRMNRELGADFQPGHFIHHAVYDPETGAAKSYLVRPKIRKYAFLVSMRPSPSKREKASKPSVPRSMTWR